jgi:hypothetical protein
LNHSNIRCFFNINGLDKKYPLCSIKLRGY